MANHSSKVSLLWCVLWVLRMSSLESLDYVDYHPGRGRGTRYIIELSPQRRSNFLYPSSFNHSVKYLFQYILYTLTCLLPSIVHSTCLPVVVALCSLELGCNTPNPSLPTSAPMDDNQLWIGDRPGFGSPPSHSSSSFGPLTSRPSTGRTISVGDTAILGNTARLHSDI